jgi:hypothetical protein
MMTMTRPKTRAVLKSLTKLKTCLVKMSSHE